MAVSVVPCRHLIFRNATFDLHNRVSAAFAWKRPESNWWPYHLNPCLISRYYLSKTISYGGNFIVYKIAIVEDLETWFLKCTRLVKFDFLKNEVLFIIKTRNVLTSDQTHAMFLSGKKHANFLWKSKFVASHTTISRSPTHQSSMQNPDKHLISKDI